jgi:hypothetical protein
MSVFAVIGIVNPNAIREAVVRQYGANHHQFAENAWFVPDNGTTKDVSDKLGITNGALNAQGVVLKFDGYSGWASAEGWKWLANQSGALPNG